MTICELAERDLKKAQISLVQARKKPNVTNAEIENLERLCAARKTILNIIKQNCTEGEYNGSEQ